MAHAPLISAQEATAGGGLSPINWCYQAYRSNNFAEAISLCEPVAYAGNANAAFIMASMLAREDFAAQDFTASVSWLEQAAESGHVEAAYNLAVSYNNGHGVERDHAKAAIWYRLAANDGSYKAQRNLAKLYEQGNGLQASDELAFHWYLKSAEGGLPDSQLKVGLMFLEGRGVAGSQQAGFDWILKAAEANYVEAQLSLALLLDSNGLGEGIPWYERAAQRGNIAALHNLAVIYLLGEQAPQDLSLALAYAESSVSLGNTNSIALKQDIDAAMLEARVGGFDGPVTSAEPQKPDQPNEHDAPPDVPIAIAYLGDQVTDIPARLDAESVQAAAADLLPSSSDTVEPDTIDPDTSQSDETKAEPAVEIAIVALEGWQRDQAWLAMRPPAHHTIQLAVASNVNAIERMVKKMGIGDFAHYFPSQAAPAGLPAAGTTTPMLGERYVLVYGEFDNRADTTAALEMLPEALRQEHWVRTFGELQRQYLAPQ